MSAADVNPSNPYSTPAPPSYEAPPQGQDYGFEAIRPLFEAAWWLKLLGWSMMIIGGLYCLSIVGILVGWLPIWMGFLLKRAGEKVGYGYQAKNWQSVFDSNQDLKTIFIITGVLMLINLAILLIYALIIILFLVISIVAGVSGAGGL